MHTYELFLFPGILTPLHAALVDFSSAEYAVHNTIHAVLRREDGPEEISTSRVAQGPSQHPYLAAADHAKHVFMRARIDLGPGAPPLHLTVMEGEGPEAAVARAVAAAPHPVAAAAHEKAVAALRRRMLRQLATEQKELEARFPPTDPHLTWARVPGAPSAPAGPDGPEPAPRGRDPLPPVKNPADAAEERDQAAAQTALHARQFPPGGCGGDRRVLVARFDRAVWGLAVNVHYLTVGAAAAAVATAAAPAGRGRARRRETRRAAERRDRPSYGRGRWSLILASEGWQQCIGRFRRARGGSSAQDGKGRRQRTPRPPALLKKHRRPQERPDESDVTTLP